MGLWTIGTLISDMEGMKGGDPELFKGDKEVGKQMLRNGELKREFVETVSYENPLERWIRGISYTIQHTSGMKARLSYS